MFFDLAFLDQLLFFGADALQQDVGGFVGGILGHKAALDSLLQQGFAQLLRKRALHRGQSFLRRTVGLHIREQFFQSGYNTLLFRQGREREF